MYIGSADWMKRNLDRRIEAVVPIEDLILKEQLYQLLNTYMTDNYFSWIMKEDGSYEKKTITSEIQRSQFDLIKT